MFRDKIEIFNYSKLEKKYFFKSNRSNYKMESYKNSILNK